MTTASIPSSSFGATCKKCGDALIAPEWSEFVSERLVIKLWSCPKCGCEFETEACMPADTEPNLDSKVLEAYFPSLLVA